MIVFISIILFVMVGPVDLAGRSGPHRHPLAQPGASWTHPMGTDQLGRDLLARMMHGGRVSVAVGLTAMLLGLVLGTLIGVLAGYFRLLDSPLMRLTDLFLALPLLPLLLILVALFRDVLEGTVRAGDGGVHPDRRRHRRHQLDADRADRARRRAGAEGARIRAGRAVDRHAARRITTRHILPNVMSPIMVSATLGIASAIITESALSFLGLGFPPDFPTWGRILYDGRDWIEQYPARVVWPGVLISLTVLSVNYIGDGLRDALDPRIRGR
jgi:peptide/nickel transport system permease protein